MKQTFLQKVVPFEKLTPTTSEKLTDAIYRACKELNKLAPGLVEFEIGKHLRVTLYQAKQGSKINQIMGRLLERECIYDRDTNCGLRGTQRGTRLVRMHYELLEILTQLKSKAA